MLCVADVFTSTAINQKTESALYFSILSCYSFFFFFSSRRRHTRLQGDWSSDVCSSDLTDSSFRTKAIAYLLGTPAQGGQLEPDLAFRWNSLAGSSNYYFYIGTSQGEIGRASCREKCRSRWSPYH